MDLLWYQTLNKPPFTPPADYFPAAWLILYALMAISFIIILFKPKSSSRTIALCFFAFQLLVNLSWSYIFFELKSIEFALIDILVLLILLYFTVFHFYKISKIAAMLLYPYLLQVIFALYLNAGFAILN